MAEPVFEPVRVVGHLERMPTSGGGSTTDSGSPSALTAGGDFTADVTGPVPPAPTPVPRNQWYVSPTGRSTNAGTLASP
jgi:hypothetical protein